MRRLVDRFGALALECSSLEELRQLLDDAAGDLGFDHFALLHHSSLRECQPGHLRIHNYPETWVEELVAGDLAAHDPVHLASRRTNIGFAWSELGSIIPLESRHRTVLSRSRVHGLGEGFTVPANVPGEPSGSCSFAVRRGSPLPDGRLRCAELVGIHAFAAARRILDLPPRGARPHLSRRQLECLGLIALGKTDWEIARILGLGVETVRQYVKAARAAYGVVSRAQLLVVAIRDDWLSPGETTGAAPTRSPRSIPPIG